MKISNPTIRMMSRHNGIALGWNDDTARYHVWLDSKTLECAIGGIGVGRLRDHVVLYKNPPLGTERQSDGWYTTKQLDGSNAVNSKIIAKVRSMIDIPAEVAARHREFDEQDAEQERKIALAKIDGQKQAAGPLLYDAVKNALGLLDTPVGRRLHENSDFYQDVIASLRDAIKVADEPAQDDE